MWRSLISIVLISVLTLSACKTRTYVRVEPARTNLDREEIVGVTTTDGKDVAFDENMPVTVRDTSSASAVIEGWVGGNRYEVAVANVQRVWVTRYEKSTARTVGLIVGVSAGAAILAVLLTRGGDEPQPAPRPPVRTSGQSCPFVYSWNGTNYVFDAEPYGGATTRGLERDDTSELDHLIASDGEYRLLMSNEQDESQFSNVIELQVVDHPSETRVVADEFGQYHTVSNPQTAIRISDGHGKDLAAWLGSKDRLIWEPLPHAGPDGNVRDEINMVFRKPPGSRHAKLVANAGTGLWGSEMIKELLKLRGRELPLFFTELDTNPLAVDLLRAWAVHEDLFGLNVFIKDRTQWSNAGTLPGGGPYIVEDRVIPVDLTETSGDEIHFQLKPPAGFWALNSFAMDFSEDVPIHVETVPAFEARDDSGRDVLNAIIRDDDKYYQMPNIGERAYLRFRAPAPRTGMNRTVFLHSRGYYNLHIRASGEPQTALLNEIESVPDTAARLSIAKYAELQR